MKTTFREKLESMTAKTVILAMVAGLENEHVRVRMNTFGEFVGGVCYGCAATNAVCEISGEKFGASIESLVRMSAILNYNPNLLMSFENAIDFLRRGDVFNYNKRIFALGIAKLLVPQEFAITACLPPLFNEDYKENLHHYVTFANQLP